MSVQPAGGPGGYRALYLRWRPRTFVEVLGQEAVTRTLKNAVVRGTVAHGYLLCGPRGTGKTSIARILYKALNCHQPRDGEPCTSCESCEASEAGRAIDLVEIDAASNRGIDDVRALRERVRFSPAGKWKVYIVDEAHQLTAPAWDAFLKTLEEPPPHTAFVLATTAAHKVPATIVSRCQRFDLRRIPQGTIAEHLERVARSEGIDLESGVTDRLSRLARGGLRDAIGMLEQVAAFAGSPVTQDAARRVLGLVRGDALRAFVDALAQRDARKALQILEDVADEGADLHQFLDEVVYQLRSALLIRTGAEDATDAGAEEREWLRGVAQRCAPSEIAAVLRAYGEIDTAGTDERQLLVRLELATVRATGLETGLSAPEPRPARAPPPELQAQGMPEPASGRETGSRLTSAAVEREPEPLDVSAPDAAPGPRDSGGGRGPLPSLAVLQARWPSILDRFQGTLFAKVLLGRMVPVAFDQGVATLEGRLDRIELQRLEASSRRGIEALVAEEFGVNIPVRFAAAQASPESPSAEPAGGGLAEYASTLFGGQVVSEGAGFG